MTSANGSRRRPQREKKEAAKKGGLFDPVEAVRGLYFAFGTLSALVLAISKSFDSSSVYIDFWRSMTPFL